MDLDPKIFEVPVRSDLIYTAVVAQAAAKRRGTKATKSRAMVSGGGRKPFRQKGTGRARQGSTRSPQFAGGGVVFGPQPRSYAQRVPKKVRKAALRAALSLRKRDQKLHVVPRFEISEIKTKQMLAKLKEMGIDDALILTAERDTRLELAARNLPHVRVLCVAGLNVRDVLLRENLVMTEAAVSAVVERLQ